MTDMYLHIFDASMTDYLQTIIYVCESVLHSAILIGFLSALCSTLLVGVVPDDSAEGKLQVALVLLGAYLSSYRMVIRDVLICAHYA